MGDIGGGRFKSKSVLVLNSAKKNSKNKNAQTLGIQEKK